MPATEKELAWCWGGRKTSMWNGGIIFAHRHGCQETTSQQESRWIIWRVETQANNHFPGKKIIDIRWMEKKLNVLPPLGRLIQQHCVNRGPTHSIAGVTAHHRRCDCQPPSWSYVENFIHMTMWHLAESYATSSVSQTLIKLLPHRVIWSTTLNISTVIYPYMSPSPRNKSNMDLLF